MVSPFLRMYKRPDDANVNAGPPKLRGFSYVGKVSEISEACKLAACKDKPPPTLKCHGCSKVFAKNFDGVGTKQGYEGAYYFGCTCGARHFPPQPGPVDEDLAVIQAIRECVEARQQEAAAIEADVDALTTELAAAKKRLKAVNREPKQPKDVTRPKRKADAALKACNNTWVKLAFKNPVPDGKGGVREGTPPAESEDVSSMRPYGGSRPTRGQTDKVTVVVWFAGDEPPLISEVELTFGDVLYKRQVPGVDKKMRGARFFEAWSSKAECWVMIEWSTTPVPVPRKSPYVFIRAVGIQCRDFGECLRRWESAAGKALPDALSVGDLVRQFVEAEKRAVVWWADDDTPPQIFVIEDDLDALEDAVGKASQVRKWMPTQSAWQVFAVQEKLPLTAWVGVTLLVSDACDSPRGVGDAIAGLEGPNLSHPSRTVTAGSTQDDAMTQPTARKRGPSQSTLGKRREFEEGSSRSGAKRPRREGPRSSTSGAHDVIDLTL